MGKDYKQILVKKLKRNRFIKLTLKRILQILSIFLLPKAIVKSFRIIFFKGKSQKNVVSLVEHLGDVVASEPVDRYLKESYPNSYIVRIVKSQYKEVMQYNPNVDKIVTVKTFTEWIYIKYFIKRSRRIKVVDLHIGRKVCSRYQMSLPGSKNQEVTFENYYDYGNLLEVFSIISRLPIPNVKPIYHLPEQGLSVLSIPEKYIVLHTTSNDNERMWTIEKWNELTRRLIEDGFYVVEVGLKATVKSNSDRFIDLCGKLTFTQIAFLIQKCFLFIGVDSSFAHFANALGVDRIILIGNYRKFNKHNPYSGLTPEELEQIILRHNGPLSKLPVNKVLERVYLRIK